MNGLMATESCRCLALNTLTYIFISPLVNFVSACEIPTNTHNSVLCSLFQSCKCEIRTQTILDGFVISTL